eukprot:scaffold59969_cov31-Tisochrysis_lutea.AAC.4
MAVGGTGRVPCAPGWRWRPLLGASWVRGFIHELNRAPRRREPRRAWEGVVGARAPCSPCRLLITRPIVYCSNTSARRPSVLILDGGVQRWASAHWRNAKYEIVMRQLAPWPRHRYAVG